MKFLVLLLGAFLLAGCTVTPNGITPLENFDIDRYLGTWYEIARLDHRFERGLSQITATYSKRPDSGIDVLNRGLDNKTGKWKEAKGRAYFISGPDVARLKVTFFWPFYGGYNVIALDREHYANALVCGPNRNYLWILARTRQLDESVLQQLTEKAERLGFDTSQLIFVDQ
ncbi:MAG: lipocalin family protein [Desulfuromonadales bacterium]|nr:lipocalin family protein [Desulfuromonadales bacterium]